MSSANVTARSIFNESIAVTTETTLGGDYHLKVASFGQYFVTVDLPGRKVEGRIVLLDQERTFRTDFRLGRKIVAWVRNETQRSWDAHSEVRAKHDRKNILGRIRSGGSASAYDPSGLALPEGALQTLGRKTCFEHKRYEPSTSETILGRILYTSSSLT